MSSQSTYKSSISMNGEIKYMHLSVDFSKELASVILISQCNNLLLSLKLFLNFNPFLTLNS